MALRLSEVIDIDDKIEARTSLRREIGRTLLLTRDEDLDPSGSGKARAFSGVSDASDFFASSAQGLAGARVYFAQSPYPRDLIVGRWVDSDQNARLVGGAPAAIATLQGITAGSFSYAGVDFTALNFASDTHTAIASELQAKIRAQSSNPNLSTVTVVWEADPGRFVVTAAGTDDAGYFGAAATGTDISGTLGLTEASGAHASPGRAQETISEALDAIASVTDFYFVCLEPSLADSDESDEAAAWCASGRYNFSGLVADSAVLTAAETTSNAAQLSATQPQRSFLTYSGRNDWSALAAAGVMAGTSFSPNGQLLTMKFRPLQNVTPVDLTSAEYSELQRKRINAFASYGSQSFYGEGYALAPGVWVDVRVFLDWIAETMQAELLSHLTSAVRIPRTRAGVSALKDVVAGVCEQGVQNGGLAPGQVSETMRADIRRTTGDDSFDGNLSSGYLVWTGPLTAGSQIAERQAPPMRVWLHGSAAVHFAEIDITYGEG